MKYLVRWEKWTRFRSVVEAVSAEDAADIVLLEAEEAPETEIIAEDIEVLTIEDRS